MTDKAEVKGQRDWLRELGEVLDNGDHDGITTLIAEIAVEAPELGPKVRDVLGSHRFREFEQLFILSATQPKAEGPKGDPPKAELKLSNIKDRMKDGIANVQGKPEEKVVKFARRRLSSVPVRTAATTIISQAVPEAEPEPEPKFEARARVKAKPRFEFDRELQPPQLRSREPMENAKAFTRDRLSTGGKLATFYYHGDWWQWNGQFYEIAPHDRIMGSVYDYLDGAFVNGDRFKPTPWNAEALIKCLKACVAIDDRNVPPRWNIERSGPPAENLLAFANGLVDVETGELIELTPDLWIHSGINFEYDPEAKCPRWELFLEEVFPGDLESQQCVEEQLGYGMTNDTRFEKGALWIGKRRSGKSTLCWVQERLAGVGGSVSLSFHDWMKTENSRAHLIGKKVGIFADVRLKPAKSYGTAGYDPGGIDHQSAQMLLQIIGRDKVSLGRKFKDAWEGRLVLKVIITSNVVPNLHDEGGVLASRFIMIDFKQSFYGREDINLRDTLAMELPGIANRCLRAYRWLCQRGAFVQPAHGRELADNVAKTINPIVAFMDNCWVEDPGGTGPTCAGFYNSFNEWCRDEGRLDLTLRFTPANLIKEVDSIDRWSWLKSYKPHGMPRRYGGIKRKEGK